MSQVVAELPRRTICCLLGWGLDALDQPRLSCWNDLHTKWILKTGGPWISVVLLSDLPSSGSSYFNQHRNLKHVTALAIKVLLYPIVIEAVNYVTITITIYVLQEFQRSTWLTWRRLHIYELDSRTHGLYSSCLSHRAITDSGAPVLHNGSQCSQLTKPYDTISHSQPSPILYLGFGLMQRTNHVMQML